MQRTEEQLKEEIIECLMSYGALSFHELQEELSASMRDLSAALKKMVSKKQIIKSSNAVTKFPYYMMP